MRAPRPRLHEYNIGKIFDEKHDIDYRVSSMSCTCVHVPSNNKVLL